MNTAAQLSGQVAEQAPGKNNLVPRRNPRFALAIPVDVTVLRCGVPDSVPGRSLNLSEGGLALALAGELRCGEPVGIEFQLPNLSSTVRAKAVVRHAAQLHSGLEFVGLAGEQQAMIRYWMATSTPEITDSTTEVPPAPKSGAKRKLKAAEIPRSLRTRIFAIGISVVIAGSALGWWHWRRAWEELESQTAIQEPLAKGWTSVNDPIRVPAEIVERLVVHTVDPVIPPNVPSNSGGSGGIVVLDAIIGSNGTIAEVHPISGPPALTASAVEAVKWWRFQPYRINGKPVRVETTLTIDFRTSGNREPGTEN